MTTPLTDRIEAVRRAKQIAQLQAEIGDMEREAHEHERHARVLYDAADEKWAELWHLLEEAAA